MRSTCAGASSRTVIPLTKPQMPPWAMNPDPSYVDAIERLRRRYAWHLDAKPLILSEGSQWEEPFTVELALEFGERLASETLE
jgi:hypothetical protein